MPEATLLEIVHRALAVCRTQTELARRMGVSDPTVSRWLAGKGGFSYESALRLARIVGLPPRQVVTAAGHDPILVPPSHEADHVLRPIELDIQQRAARISALIEAAEGLPDDFVETYVRSVLDRAEEEIVDILAMVRGIRAKRATKRRLTEIAKQGNPVEFPSPLTIASDAPVDEPQPSVHPTETEGHDPFTLLQHRRFRSVRAKRLAGAAD